MKKTTIPKWTIQSLFFSIIILIVFISISLIYFLPEYLKIEEKKITLNILQKNNAYLLQSGLPYDDFKRIFIKDLSKNKYLTNLFSKENKKNRILYESNFINNDWNKSYETFILEKEKKIRKQEESLETSKIKEKIKKILPYYKDNAALSWYWITDFKFINYIEKLINTFWLEYSGSIWIWELKLEEDSLNVEKKKSKLDWEIYSFKLPLDLTWRKKNIIDFIHYIENVWKIKFTKDGKNIKIKKPVK